MAVTVKTPLATPSPTVSLSAGGNLPIGVTYYIRVFATQRTNQFNYGSNSRESLLSTEIAVTTDSTNRTIDISWGAITDANRYMVLISKTSGDYNYYTSSWYRCSGFLSTTSFTFSDEAQSGLSTLMYHSAQSNLPYLPAGIDKNLGLLEVRLDGSVTLQDIKDAIDAAGYSGYCYYDGHIFVLKGAIHILSGVTGVLGGKRDPNYLYGEYIHFIGGTLLNQSSNFTIRTSAEDPSTTNIGGGSAVTMTWSGWSTSLQLDYLELVGGKFSPQWTYKQAGVGSGSATEPLIWLGDTSLRIKDNPTNLDCVFTVANRPSVSADTTLDNPILYGWRTGGSRSAKITINNGYLLYTFFYENAVKPAILNRTVWRHNYYYDLGTRNNGNDDGTNYFQLNSAKLPHRSDGLPVIQWYYLWVKDSTHVFPVVYMNAFANLKVVDELNNPISGARVKITDLSDNSTIVDLTTDANGEIPEQKITWLTIEFDYNNASVGSNYLSPTMTIYNYKGDFKIEITKAGYKKTTLYVPRTFLQNYELNAVLPLSRTKTLNLSNIITIND